MASPRPIDPPRFLPFKSLRRRRVLELGLTIALVFAHLLAKLVWDIEDESTFGEATGLALAAVACAWTIRGLRLFFDNPTHAAQELDKVDVARAIWLPALPTGFAFARLSHVPFIARLLRARLEFHDGWLAIAWLSRQRRIFYRELSRADWQHDGVLLFFHDGRKLLLPTCRPPRFSGPSDHYRELRRATAFATWTALRHNQRIAARIEIERSRLANSAYRTPSQA